MEAQGKGGVPAPQHGRAAIAARVVVFVLAALVFGAAPAAASDLLLLSGESATLSGTVAYDVVRVESGATLNIAGNTTLTALSVYVDAAATFRPCFTPPNSATCAAGTNLTIATTGSIVIEQPIALTGTTGNSRPGGNLVLAGSNVTVGGAINTSGSVLNGTFSATSGNVTIGAPGGVVLEGVTAPAASVDIQGGQGIAITGDVNVSPIAATPLAAYGGRRAGAVSLVSTSGDVAITGNLNGTGTAAGDGAGTAVVKGATIALGNVTLRPAAGGGVPTGTPGALAVTATEAIGAGAIDLSGQTGTPGSAGGAVALVAGTHTATAAINVAGASGATGSPGGSIAITTTGASLGALTSSGGNSTGGGVSGAPAGAITVAGTGTVTTGALTANGGNSGTNANAVNGGAIAVTGRTIATGAVNANAGTTNGAGGNGGSIRLLADGSLTVGSAARVSASVNASANASAAGRNGGDGGAIVLRAGTGTLSAGIIRANGSAGGPVGGQPKAGAGGHGGVIDLVAGRLGALGSVVATGGAAGSGAATGPTANAGGPGGTVRVWAESDLSPTETSVSTAGGNGSPLGPDGAVVLESSPSALRVDALSGVLSFSSRSPDAQGFHVLRSVAGAAATALLDSTGTPVTPPAPPMCTDVTYAVQAFHTGVGWLSPVVGPVGYQRQPSATQKCTDAPGVKVGKKLRVKLKALKRAKWKLNVTVKIVGSGSVSGKLLPRKAKKKAKPLATVTRAVAAGGKVKLAVVFPKAARHAGRFVVQFETRAMLGKAVKRGTVNLEVLK